MHTRACHRGWIALASGCIVVVAVVLVPAATIHSRSSIGRPAWTGVCENVVALSVEVATFPDPRLRLETDGRFARARFARSDSKARAHGDRF
jgi:hypothetical protein